MTRHDVIELDPTGFVAEGNGCYVFEHPDDPRTLLKIPKIKRPKKLRRRITASLRPSKRRYGPFREWYHEYEEYIAAVHTAGALPRCLPRLHGFIQTSLGPAFAVEKISDQGATTMALTIQGYLAQHDPEDLRHVLEEFFDEIQKHRIILFDLKLYNQCVVRDVTGTPIRVVSIDSIGESTLFQVRKWSRLAYQAWFRSARRNFMDLVFNGAD